MSVERKVTANHNFEYWFSNVADIPKKDLVTGKWFDLETGIPFDADADYGAKAKPRTVHSEKTLSSRNIAKFFGGKALTGSAKQVKWGEEIRAEKLRNMNEEQAIMCCAPTSVCRYAKFWINNREKSAKEIGDFGEISKTLMERYRQSQLDNDAESARSISDEYNALTAAWGFE